MLKVPTKEFQRNSKRYLNQALNQAITITNDDQDLLVIITADEYHILRKRARVALSAGEMSDFDIQQLEKTNMSSEHAHLNIGLDTQENN